MKGYFCTVIQSHHERQSPCVHDREIIKLEVHRMIWQVRFLLHIGRRFATVLTPPNPRSAAYHDVGKGVFDPVSCTGRTGPRACSPIPSLVLIGGGPFAPEPTCRRFYYVGYTFSRPYCCSPKFGLSGQEKHCMNNCVTQSRAGR